MVKNKSAIVTGSTSGIGLGIARALAASGINIMLNGFADSTLIEKIKAELAVHKVKISYHPADMRKADDIAAMVDAARHELGGADILVNNAGIQHVAPVHEFPPDKWDEIISVNLTAAFHATRHALPHMREKGWGRVVNIASAHGLVASPFKSAYVAAKHGLVGFTKSAALECARENITINAICPGYVLTPLVEKQIPDTAKARGISIDDVVQNVILVAQPNKKFTGIDQVASLVLYLCSDAASAITGAALSIDGGWTAQ